MYISNGAYLITCQGGLATYHRADLQEVLLNHVSSSIQCHLNHRLVNYKQSNEGIELEFKNGETASCDILVGADGINSVVRKVFLADKQGINSSSEEALTNAAPVWSGTSVYRGLVDSEVIKRELPNHRALTTPMMVRSHLFRLSLKYQISLTKIPICKYCGKNKVREFISRTFKPSILNVQNSILSRFQSREENLSILSRLSPSWRKRARSFVDQLSWKQIERTLCIFSWDGKKKFSV